MINNNNILIHFDEKKTQQKYDDGHTVDKYVDRAKRLWVMPPSHRMRGATDVRVRHKPQWHRHDRRSSAVVPSLIAVAPPKTVKNRGPSPWHGGNF